MGFGRNGQELLIANPGWTGTAVVDVADPVFSLDTGAPGSFSCFLPPKVARTLGWTGDALLDRWVQYEDPDFGTWYGVVETTTPTDDVGSVELTARTFHMLLSGWRTRVADYTFAGPPGMVALRAVKDVELDTGDSLLLTSYRADTDGEPIEWQWQGEDLAETLDQIADQGNMEWRVSGGRRFEMRNSLGSDKTRSIEWVIGIHASECQSSFTTAGLVNDLLAVGGDDTYKNAQVYRAVDRASVRRLRRRQGTQRYVALVTKGALRPRARADVRRLAVTPGAARVLVARHATWASVREGDTVALTSPTANRSYKFRIESFSVDPMAGVLDASGRILGTL